MVKLVTSHAVQAPASLLIRTANAFLAGYTLIASGEIDGFASNTVETVFILRRSQGGGNHSGAASTKKPRTKRCDSTRIIAQSI